MDNNLWIIIFVFVVVVLVIFRYRKEIAIKLKISDAEIELNARDTDEPAKEVASANPVVGERGVQIGGNADNAKIVTGENNKVG